MKKYFWILLAIVLVMQVVLQGCASAKTTVTTKIAATGARPAVKGLTAIEAQRRKAMVTRVDYALDMFLNETDDDFQGVVRMSLELAKPVYPLSIDFFEGTVVEVRVAGKPIPADYNGHFVTIPPGELRAGANQISIRFKHKYSRTGDGLHRFKDPEDGRVYLYSDFEPYDANQMFPCLDQPDLKARYTLTVEAPRDWTVISTQRESQTSLKGKKKIWSFGPTPRLSTYVFSLHAGPYQEWHAQAGQVPLRLFARRALAKYVKSAEWFKITQQGLEHYRKYYQIPYPFKKYDQVIVPEFNSGAMENVAAVTFTESVVSRGVETKRERESRAGVILHEMAHMWFGDLVTMQWWNGLWLNESFATFMAASALHDATEFKTSWLSFFNSQKRGAYIQDQLETTHPIDTEVTDTVTAFANFDGITYGKGASVLKQLVYYVGESKFREGVRMYLKAHSYNNARLEDFLGAIERVSGKNLKAWSEEWLRTAGLNTLEAKYDCADGKIRSFSLEEGFPAEHPKLRRHRTLVALYDAKFQPYAQEAVEYDGPALVQKFVGKKCPVLVFPNAEDHDFAKVRLDPRSLGEARARLSAVADPLLRSMIWSSIFEMVRDAKWPATSFIELAVRELVKEKDFKVASQVAFNLTRMPRYLPLYGEPGETEGKKYLESIESMFLGMLKLAQPGSDMQKLWYDHFVMVAQSPYYIDRLADIVSGKLKLAGLSLDQDRRWGAIVRLSMFAHASAALLVETEKKKDPSDRGRKMLITVEAVRPEEAVKAKWWKELVSLDTKYASADLKHALGIFPRSQNRLAEPYSSEFFKALETISDRKDSHFMTGFVDALSPTMCTSGSVDRLSGFISKHEGLPANVVRALKQARQEDDRCVRIRELAFRR